MSGCETPCAMADAEVDQTAASKIIVQPKQEIHLKPDFDISKVDPELLQISNLNDILPFSEFKPFPKLPIELREMIWKLNLPGPHIVEIEWCTKAHQWLCPRSSLAKPSALARVNHESREYYLKSYMPLCKLCDVGGPAKEGYCNHTFTQHAIAYFNPKIDLLYIVASSSSDLVINAFSLAALAAIPVMARVEVLAFEYHEWCDCFKGPKLVPWQKELIIGLGDFAHTWFREWEQAKGSRVQGEIELIEPRHGLDWGYEMSEVRSNLEQFPMEQRPKLTFKSVLRGGLNPIDLER